MSRPVEGTRGRILSNIGRPRFSSTLRPIKGSSDHIIESAGDEAKRIVDAEVADEGNRRKEFSVFLQQIVDKAVKKGDDLEVMESWKADYERLFENTNKSCKTLNRMRNDGRLREIQRVVMREPKGRITKKKPFSKASLIKGCEPKAIFPTVLFSWEEEIKMTMLPLEQLAVVECEERAHHARSLATHAHNRALIEATKNQQLVMLANWKSWLEGRLLEYVKGSQDVRKAGLQIKYELCRLSILMKQGQPPLFNHDHLNHWIEVDTILARVQRWEVPQVQSSISHHRRIGRRIAIIEGVRHSGEAKEDGGLYLS